MKRHADDLLSAFLDGELSDDEERHVGDHVAGCDSCRDELASIAQVRGALRGLPTLHVPSGVFDVGDATVTPIRRQPLAWVGAAAAAAVAFVALVAGLAAPPDPAPLQADELRSVFVSRTVTDPGLLSTKIVGIQGTEVPAVGE